MDSSIPQPSDSSTFDGLSAWLGNRMSAAESNRDYETAIANYREALPQLEQALWSGNLDEQSVAKYQRSFRDYEKLVATRGRDDRHQIIIVIPVADRPQQLTQCLASIFRLCECYHYGGYQGQHYTKIRVVIADDSAHPDSISRHNTIARRFDSRGLRTEYFGLNEQIAQIRRLGERQKTSLTRIIGNTDALDPARFSHKGASITRNIAYLRLRELVEQGNSDRTLIQFIDSDQEFCVILPDAGGDKTVYAINYFHHLDEIFTNTDASILTGKVVGDPPVSPAVMASNFQDDITGFLSRQADLQPTHACAFHDSIEASDHAAYHDMANLFGINCARQSYQYRCTLEEPHGNADCLVDFSAKLNRFFFGEHPTRVTYFDYQGSLSETIPARTIYTGNYVFRPECLGFFIPFATLKLRMAGPVLGRLLQKILGERFVSANLPMLHKRTLVGAGESEFRPDVSRTEELIDLSGEFERQYFGDVMLFTIAKLAEQGFPEQPIAESTLEQLLIGVEGELYGQYQTKHREILSKLDTLQALVKDPSHWWQQDADLEPVRRNFAVFIASIQFNFNQESRGWHLINSNDEKQRRLRQIAHAILHYGSDCRAWQDALQ